MPLSVDRSMEGDTDAIFSPSFHHIPAQLQGLDHGFQGDQLVQDHLGHLGL